jgi:hypothetical protein
VTLLELKKLGEEGPELFLGVDNCLVRILKFEYRLILEVLVDERG